MDKDKNRTKEDRRSIGRHKEMMNAYGRASGNLSPRDGIEVGELVEDNDSRPRS